MAAHGADAVRAAIAGAEPEPAPPPEPEAVRPKHFYYDGLRYYLDTGRDYVPMDGRSVTLHLAGAGLAKSEIDPALCEIQTRRFVSYCGPLAGHARGLHEANGARLLATCSPRIIPARPGAWPTIRAVLEALLDDEEAEVSQVEILLGWLKTAREALLAGSRRPGQALALCGPVACGKSLLLDLLEACLGGRRCNPYPHFSGRTNFNGDLAGAELLAVDDEAGSTDIRARKHLAANIKSHLFSGAVRIEAKNRTAFVFRPVWRLVFCLNDEPESLLVLPPLTVDLADKVSLLRCHRRPLPMPSHTLSERERFFDTLVSEIPALAAYLESWEIPAGLEDERCGVRHFHHPALLAELHTLSPEGQLAALLDAADETGALPLPWQGTAASLKAVLCGMSGASGKDAERLLGGWHGALGAYLARLEGGRVRRLSRVEGTQRWEILPKS